MLQVSGLHFCYGSVPVLRDISFGVEQGTLCGLFGPNGSGKTTLFKCCLKFLKTQKGSVRLNGKDIRTLKYEDTAKLVSYVPQEHKPPFPYLVREVVLMGRTPHLGGFFGISRRDRMIARDAIETIGITELADRPYNQLSGGQRQMVLMARAIAQETPMMFLDEPTSALDYSNQVKIWKIMRMIADEGTTILACSHDPNHVAWFCDKVVVMNENSITAEGLPSTVITEEVLGKIYTEDCTVRTVGGVNIVIPRCILENRYCFTVEPIRKSETTGEMVNACD
ncbi:MAG TPA: ABC transporter ATP-binding protein [Methanoregulaceae archaeon]|nr:MAG: ABC transporter ATP-binding protein [Methanolinea sp.]HON81499.1 ABC transporter ATP-binding protein [Methanoregulaceae archaeon]HPD10305.1 ABC transporter ATP-binding protein [Methanoregulaceae archaeon]